MICPKCGVVQPDAPVCVRCGVIIEKALKAQRAREADAKPADTKKSVAGAIRPRREPAGLPLLPGQPAPVAPAEPQLPSASFTEVGLRDREKMALLEQLRRMVGAGLPVVSVLESSADIVHNRRMRAVCSHLADRVRAGDKLGAAMRTLPRDFDPHEVGSVAAGELSGALPETLARLSSRIDRRIARRRQLLRGIFYVLVMLIISIFLMPLSSLLLGHAGLYWRAVLIPLGGLVSLAFGLAWLRGHLKGHPQYGPIVRRVAGVIPLVAGFMRREAYATYCEHLADAFRAGLPVATSLGSAAEATGHPRFIKATRGAVAAIDGGVGLTDALGKSGLFPDSAMLAIAGGERSGDLEDSFRQLARHADEDLDHQTSLAITLGSILISLLVLGLVAMRVYSNMASTLGGVEDEVMKMMPYKSIPHDLEGLQKMMNEADEALHGSGIRPMPR